MLALDRRLSECRDGGDGILLVARCISGTGDNHGEHGDMLQDMVDGMKVAEDPLGRVPLEAAHLLTFHLLDLANNDHALRSFRGLLYRAGACIYEGYEYSVLCHLKSGHVLLSW